MKRWTCCVNSASACSANLVERESEPDWHIGRADENMENVLNRLGLAQENDGVFFGEWRGGGAKIDKISPINGKKLASVRTASADDYDIAIARAHEAFLKWRTTPGPVRGDTVRRLGNALREAKNDLGQLVTLETGKIIAEGEGEVQEMIDICDFAVGQSRMLYGLTIQSERPSHRLMEQWHPLGVDRGDQRFQFSGRCLVVERSARRRLRRCDGLESFGKNAAHCDCSDKDCGTRLSRNRSGSGDFHFADGRP